MSIPLRSTYGLYHELACTTNIPTVYRDMIHGGLTVVHCVCRTEGDGHGGWSLLTPTSKHCANTEHMPALHVHPRFAVRTHELVYHSGEHVQHTRLDYGVMLVTVD